VTNGPAEVQRAKAKLLQIADLVDFVLISEEFGSAKPEPEIFREALRRLRVSERDAIFVGDSLELDIAGAQGAGIRSVWVNRDRIPWEATAPAPSRMIHSLDELLALIGLSS
jgi:putative hydrolase of the HAD superfamily